MQVSSAGRTLPERGLRILVLAVACGFGVAGVVFAIRDWSLVDMEAYWSAALRLRDGLPLYPPLADTTTADVYRYAPWFAFAWVPLTFLPKAIVGLAWSLVLLAATLAVGWAIVRRPSLPSIAAGAILMGLLFPISATGNVHALLVAALLFGVERRSGPLWIALAASLKLVPILFVLVYLGHRDWRRAAETMVLTAVLVAPMLLFDLRHYPVSSGELSYSLFDRAFVPWLAIVAALCAVTVIVASRASAHAWLAASVAAIAALPRLWTYDFTFLAAGLAADRSEKQ